MKKCDVLRKLSFFAFLCLICSSCMNNGSLNYVIGKSLDTTFVLNSISIKVMSIKKKEYDLKYKMNSLSIDSSRFYVIDGILKVKLEGDKHLTLVDSLDTSDHVDQVRYEYIGYYKNPAFHVVRVKYYETGEYFLINDRTGKITKIWDFPVLSPKNNYFAIASNSIGYDLVPNGIQVWQVKNDRLELMWELQTVEWGPEGIVWVNEREIYFRKHMPSSISGTNFEIGYSSLIFD